MDNTQNESSASKNQQLEEMKVSNVDKKSDDNSTIPSSLMNNTATTDEVVPKRERKEKKERKPKDMASKAYKLGIRIKKDNFKSEE